jgi:hypothetical protein
MGIYGRACVDIVDEDEDELLALVGAIMMNRVLA